MPLTWTFRETDEAPADLDRWAERLSISPLLARLLWQRGQRTPEDMQVFLSPGLKHLAALEEVPGLCRAAEVLAQGLRQGKRLAVWGDYDVDGVTATAVVKDCLAGHGIEVMHHLPNRLEEGYGLNCQGIEALAEAGADMLLTVDCGISNTAEVTRARELGMTVVVSDHHLPGDEIPDAHAVVDPRLQECPCPDLAGVGVAFLLMAGVNRLLPAPPQPVDMRRLLDLVALGTVADVVGLRGQNRILVKNGMLLLSEARRPGIAALKEASGLDMAAPLGTGQVGFGLAPRINAAGRLGDAELALSCLLAPDLATARPLARKLDAMNADRRRAEETIQAEAMEQAGGQLDRLGLVCFAPHWHSGVIGIVASRLVEAFYRPTLILTEEDGLLKGSGRSTAEFDLFQGLTDCKDLLSRFGGHRQAAGLALEPDNLDALRERFHDAVAAQTGPEPLTATLRLDGELPLGDIDFTLLKELDLLQPFGPGNAEPKFASQPLLVRGVRHFGKDRSHAKLTLTDEQSGVTMDAKAWRQAEALPAELAGQRIRIAFSPRLDTYTGVPSIDLQLKDWKPV